MDKLGWVLFRPKQQVIILPDLQICTNSYVFYRAQILFIHPRKIDFGLLLILILLAVRFYLDGIKQVTEKSEKKALWKIVMIVIRGMSIIIGIIVVALALLDTLYLHRII